MRKIKFTIPNIRYNHNLTNSFWERAKQAANRRLAKVTEQCSVDTFVVNQSLILHINICGKNRHLRQAPNR